MIELYPYQKEVSKEGLKLLTKHKHLYLALEQRYGKTPITIDILSKQNPTQAVLWVTTKSALQGINKVYHDMDTDIQLYVTNYESLHKLVKRDYDTIVLDEAHTKISKFPKPSNTRKELDKIEYDQVIWLSGTPQIESSSKLYHQLNISKHHPYSSYKNFYQWHKEFGIQGLTIYTGGPRPAVDYSKTVDFSQHFKSFMIKRTLDDTRMDVKHPIVLPEYIDMPIGLSKLYHDMWTTSVVTLSNGTTVIASNAAAKHTKCQQIAGGTLIDDDNNTHYLSDYRIRHLLSIIDDNGAVFYKYQAEKGLLAEHLPEERLFQIDASSTGLDLSHFDKMYVYSLTYSGSNFSQVLSRLTNISRSTHPEIIILVASGTIDEKIYKEVSHKRDSNTRFLKENT